MTTTTSVQNLASYASGDSSAAVSGNGSVSQLFTTLLVAQIRNQNPLEPQDPSAFVNQLTQLSQMEALQKLAAQASANAAMLESLQVLALGAQVGSQVTASTEKVMVGETPVEGRFTLASASSRVSLVLESATNEEYRIELGTRSPGDVPFTIDPATHGIPAGTYAVRVETDSNESPTVEVRGMLRSVRFSAAEGVVLDVANLGQVLSSAITSFDGPLRTALN